MAAKKTTGAKKAGARPARKTTAKSPAKGSAKSTAQKPLATGDVEQFPKHTFRADMGEGLPDQKSALNPNRAK